MPEISRFYGIIIAIFHNEHSPPHFHAKYGDYHAVIKIKDFALVEGYLPPKALGLIMEWTGIHQKELLTDWELAMQKKPLLPIDPLN